MLWSIYLLRTSEIVFTAPARSSLVMTRGGAKRIVVSCVSFARIPLSISSSEKGRAGSWWNARLLRPRRRIHYNSTRKGDYDAEYWNAGWHFSFLHNDIADIQKKVAAYVLLAPLSSLSDTAIALTDRAAQAVAADPMDDSDDDHLQDCLDHGRDLFRRKRYKFEYLDNLDYLPEYVRNNLEKFGKHIREAANVQS